MGVREWVVFCLVHAHINIHLCAQLDHFRYLRLAAGARSLCVRNVSLQLRQVQLRWLSTHLSPLRYMQLRPSRSASPRSILTHLSLQQIMHRMMAASIHEAVRARDAEMRSISTGITPLMHNGIIVLSRGQGRARSMLNEVELIASLQAAFPGRLIEAFEPLDSLLKVSQRLYGAALIIGPHGANLNNLYGARVGTAVIEVAFNGGMFFPSEYFCLARNLGLRYWMSPSKSGDYGSPMQVDIDDVLAIAKLALAHS